MQISNRGVLRTPVTRRQVLLGLGASAASLAVAACGQTTAPGASSGPAQIKGTSLAFIGGTYFVAAAQELFTKQINEWGKANGVTVSADYMNWPDLQAKVAASIQAGAGADMVELWTGWIYLYENSLADLTDMAVKQEKDQGGYYDWVSQSTKASNGKYYGLPIANSNSALNFRISYVKQAGATYESTKTPWDTYDDFFALGKKLKAMGKPMGQALGHSLGDPPGWCYPYMWAHGAMELEKDLKTIAFNKPEFVDAMKKFIQAWKDCYDTTGLSWDDSANNRAFLSDQISITQNGSSIYEAAKKDAPQIAADLDHGDMPRGPHGRFYELESKAFGILKSSKNQAAAKEFLQWWSDPKQFREWLVIQGGYQLPGTKFWENDEGWKGVAKDPKMAAFLRESSFGRPMGYMGPPAEKAALVKSKYIIVDTFARAVDSGDAAAAIKWGEEQLKQTYGV